MPLCIPEVRPLFLIIADALEPSDPQAAKAIRYLVSQLHRRPYVRRAPRQSRKITPERRRRLRELALTRPDLTYQTIAEHEGVGAGRVSEAVAGFRRAD